MHRRNTVFAWAIILLAVCSPLLHAQNPAAPNGSIHTTGQHVLKLAPQKLRLSIEIRAEGADAKSAIAALMKHKERVKKELAEMKADESSIEFSSPDLSSGVPGAPGRWSVYPPQLSFAQPVAPPAPSTAPNVYTAVAHLKVEWPLPTADADALALLPESLKEQITARDLMGHKNQAKLDKVQQEKLEELQTARQEAPFQMPSVESPPFTVLFVAKADEDARKQAIKAAYDDAVAKAETLGTVTGHKLGQLVTLHCEETPSLGVGDTNLPYAAVANYPSANMYQSPGDAALSTNPSGLGIGIKVDVEFAIAK